MNHPSLILVKNLFNIFKKDIFLSILLTLTTFIILLFVKPNAPLILVFLLLSFGYSVYVAFKVKYFIPTEGSVKGFNYKYFFSLPIKNEHLVGGLFLGTIIQSIPTLFFIGVYNVYLAKIFFLKKSPILDLSIFSISIFLLHCLFNIQMLRAEILKPRRGLQKIDSVSQNLEILMYILLALLLVRLSNFLPPHVNSDYFYDHILFTWRAIPLLMLLNILTVISALRLMKNESACYTAPLLQSNFKKIVFFFVSFGLTLSFVYI